MNIALICEGVSESKILNHFIERLGRDDVTINPIQPKLKEVHGKIQQAEHGGWSQVIAHCNDKTLMDAFETNDLLVIQIDTDACYQSAFGLSSLDDDNQVKNDERLYTDICTHLSKDISPEIYEKYKDKIIFAICFNEIECWLLPFLTTNTKLCNATNNCIHKVNDLLKSKRLGIPEKDKNCQMAINAYRTILKSAKKKKDIENASKFNYGFQRFYDDLTKALNNE